MVEGGFNFILELKHHFLRVISTSHLKAELNIACVVIHKLTWPLLLLQLLMM